MRKKLPVKAFVAIGLVVGIGASLMTAVGSGGTDANKDDISDAINTLKENVFVYNIGSFRAFDRTVSSDFVNTNGGYLYGRATLGGAIDYYGTSILNSMGISAKSARSAAMVPIQDNSVIIGKDGRGWNFAYTGFYYFWFDGGFICLVIFSFLFGFFIRYSVELFERTGTIGSMALVCYMFHACQMMTGTWVNIELYTQPVIIIFYILHKMELKKRKYEVYKKV